MAKMTYGEQLRHPNWQRRRLEVMSAAGFACECCGDKDTTLNVHHKRYTKGRMVWDYDDEDLACLCQPCHEEQHQNRELLDFLLAREDAVPLAVGLVAGYLDGCLSLPEELEADARRIGGMYFVAGQIAQFLGFTGDNVEGRAMRRKLGQLLKAWVEDIKLPTNPAEELLIQRLCAEPNDVKDA